MTIFKDGSNTKKGYLYHDLPGLNLPSHRKGTVQRVKKIASLVNFEGKRVLDLGCSVGGISMLLSMEGARVKGVDYDTRLIWIGQQEIKKRRLRVHLSVLDITPSFIKKIGKFDIVVWLSQWMWFVKQYGLEKGLNALYDISTRCGTLIFESASQDGRAKIEGATQDIIHQWLIEHTAFQKIERYKQDSHGWHDRDLFICTDPKFEWRNHKKVRIVRTGKNRVEKINELGKIDVNMKREARFMKELKDSPLVPNLISIKKDRMVMSYGGKQITELTEEDIEGLLFLLREHKIIHRDIMPSNLLRKNGHVVLIDFGWAIKEGEDLPAGKYLGEEWKCPDGFDDEWSLKAVQRYLKGERT
jgi:SAM-dependent methyltransferase